MDESRLLLTPEAAASRLSCGRSTVYDLIAEGRLESIRIGRSRRIPVSALERFIEAQREMRDREAAPA